MRARKKAKFYESDSESGLPGFLRCNHAMVRAIIMPERCHASNTHLIDKPFPYNRLEMSPNRNFMDERGAHG